MIDKLNGTATKIVETFKGQPLSLGLLLINIGLLALFWYVIQVSEHRQTLYADERKDMVELLAKCKS